MSRRSYAWYCASVDERTRRFARVTRDADLSAMVPTCPGWTIADLIRHHGTSQRRVSTVLRTRAQQAVLSRDLEVGWPDGRDGRTVAQWYDAGRAELVEALRETDPQLPVWTNGREQQAGYWARRILHEAVVHGADADIARGRPADVPEPLAWDGIEEFLDTVSRQAAVADRAARLGHQGATIDLVSTDRGVEAGHRWRIRLSDGTFTWTRGSDSGRPDARVDATAADLLLLVYGRPAALRGPVRIEGAGGLVDHWLTAVRW
jgi:uncharacterized protein (TIGR03083 family)